MGIGSERVQSDGSMVERGRSQLLRQPPREGVRQPKANGVTSSREVGPHEDDTQAVLAAGDGTRPEA